MMHRFESDNTIWPQPCPKLVEIVEHGQLGDHDLVMRTVHGGRRGGVAGDDDRFGALFHEMFHDGA